MDSQAPGDGAGGNISLLQLFSAIMQQQLQGNAHRGGNEQSGSGTANTDNTYSTISTPTALGPNGTAMPGVWVTPPVPPQFPQQHNLQGLNGIPDSQPQNYRRLSREERKHLTDQERKERIRTKNRLAQQRFRDRRKAKKEASLHHFDDICDELDRLQDENDLLRDHEAIMAKLILIRSGIIHTLNAGKKAHQQPTTGARASPAGTEGSAQATANLPEVKQEPETGANVGIGPRPIEEDSVPAGIHSSGAEQSLGPPLPVQPIGTHSKQAILGKDGQTWASSSDAGPNPRIEEFKQEQVLSLQQWLAEIRQLTEKAAALGFPSDVMQTLEQAVKRQLESWALLAERSPVKYARMIGCLLPPRDLEDGVSPGVGTVARQTLVAVASGIDTPALYDLKKQQEVFAATARSASHALSDWMRDVLPSLILCVGNSVESPLNSLATRHLLVGMAAARLEAVPNDIWTSVAGFGPSWNKVRDHALYATVL